MKLRYYCLCLELRALSFPFPTGHKFKWPLSRAGGGKKQEKLEKQARWEQGLHGDTSWPEEVTAARSPWKIGLG